MPWYVTYHCFFCKVEEDKPEDCIPDLPENEQAREFLSKAPTKGLWMPLGKEVKVMKCKTRLLAGPKLLFIVTYVFSF